MRDVSCLVRLAALMALLSLPSAVACSGAVGPSASPERDASEPVCGNGVVEPPELCDGDCPTSCDDGDPCTTDSLVGSGCDRQCIHTRVTACAPDDG